MKTMALSEPKPHRTFRDNYLAVVMMVAALFITSILPAQTDSAKYSRIPGFGFTYKRWGGDSIVMIPLSTSPHTPYRAGGIRYNPGDSTLQLWTGHQWNSIVTGGSGIDTAYALNDSIITIETPNQTFFVVLKGQNISNTALTANDDYTQNWNRHRLIFDTTTDVRIFSHNQDWNFTNNMHTFLFEHHNSVIGLPPLALKWSLRNVTNSFDSVGGGIISDLYSTTITHYTGGQSGQLYLGEGTAQLAGYGAKSSTITAYNGTITLDAADSTRIRLKPSATAAGDSMVVVRNYGFGLNTLVKVPMPTSGSDSFGLQDNIGVRNRYMNMQGHDFAIDSAGQMDLKGQAGGINGQLTLGNIAHLFSYDNGVHVHGISVYPTYIAVNGSASDDPPKIWIQASDSLKELSPSSVVVFKNDTLKTIPVADLASLLGAGINFANTDLTFTNNRIHDNAGFSFILHGTGDNAFKTVNGTKQYTVSTSSAVAGLSASNSANNYFSEVNSIDSSVILNGGENGLFYNQLEVSKNNIRLTTRANTTPHIFKLDNTGQMSNDAYVASFETSDSSMQALVVDGSGNIYKRRGDNGGGGGGSGGATLSNQGTGYRWVKTADGQIKTAVAGDGQLIDSATNTLTFKRDTTSANGDVTRSELKDTTARLKRAISDSLIYALKSILIPSRLEFIASADTATYQDSALIGSQIMMLSIESYQVGFTTRSTSVYMSFDSVTGTITLTNGEFTTGDQIIVIYRTPPVFLLDGSGNPIRDVDGNFIILN